MWARLGTRDCKYSFSSFVRLEIRGNNVVIDMLVLQGVETLRRATTIKCHWLK